MAVGVLLLVMFLMILDSLRLRRLYHKLSKTQNDLEFAEKSLLAAVKDTNIFYWEYYPQSSMAMEGSPSKKFMGVYGKITNYPQAWLDLHIIYDADVPEFLRIHNEILAGADSSSCELRTFQDGKYVWEHIRYTVIQKDDNGKALRVIGTAVGIQREKDLEQRYNEQLNTKKVLVARAKGYCKLDVTSNKVLEVSHVAPDCKPEDFSTGDSLLLEMRARVAADSNDGELQILSSCAGLREAFRQGNTHYEFEVLYAFTTGDKTWANAISDLLENPSTGHLEAYISLLDIQKVKQTEFRYKVHLEDALAKAEKASSAKGDFLSMMSHEIRTPMNVITGFTDLALDECKDKNIGEYLKKIKFSNALLLGLINDILDMSKLENSKLDLHYETVDADEFIGRLNELIKPQLQAKNISFVVRDIGEKGLFLKLDRIRCQQIFMNLFSNATKFTNENGRVELFMDTEKIAPDAVQVTIKVKDNGIGMSPEFLKKIFLPFEQENDARVSQYTGTGLGMSITKRLVKLMNGSISVESVKNVGTEFTVVLPLAIGKAEDVKQEGLVAQDFDKTKLSGVRVLVAEDQPINVEIVRKLLEKEKLVVEVSQNGKECLDKFRTKPAGYYGAILMDVRMPVMNGLDATREIRSLNRADAKTIPIIAMTANAFVSDQAETKAAGMNAHLAKPINPQEMYSILAHFICTI